jgi:tellurite methyltransferase
MTPTDRTRADRAHWEERYTERGEALDRSPSPWIIERALALPDDAIILDLAGGTGRHAEPLAAAGKTVVVVDFIPRAVRAAVGRHPGILGVVADATALPIRTGALGAIICVSFLDRSIFSVLRDLLAPGGTLLYETFTMAHLDVVAQGKARGPRNPEFLLHPNELPALAAPLTVQEHFEGMAIDVVGERSIARVRAVKR